MGEMNSPEKGTSLESTETREAKHEVSQGALQQKIEGDLSKALKADNFGLADKPTAETGGEKHKIQPTEVSIANTKLPEVPDKLGGEPKGREAETPPDDNNDPEEKSFLDKMSDFFLNTDPNSDSYSPVAGFVGKTVDLIEKATDFVANTKIGEAIDKFAESRGFSTNISDSAKIGQSAFGMTEAIAYDKGLQEAYDEMFRADGEESTLRDSGFSPNISGIAEAAGDLLSDAMTSIAEAVTTTSHAEAEASAQFEGDEPDLEFEEEDSGDAEPFGEDDLFP